MKYIILDTHPVINNVTHSNFINVLDITNGICNCAISNNESTVHSITIINNDVTKSVNDYFTNI